MGLNEQAFIVSYFYLFPFHKQKIDTNYNMVKNYN